MKRGAMHMMAGVVWMSSSNSWGLLRVSLVVVAAAVELEEVALEEVPGPVTWSSQLLLSLQGTAHQPCCSGERLKLFNQT